MEPDNGCDLETVARYSASKKTHSTCQKSLVPQAITVPGLPTRQKRTKLGHRRSNQYAKSKILWVASVEELQTVKRCAQGGLSNASRFAIFVWPHHETDSAADLEGTREPELYCVVLSAAVLA